MKPVFSPPFLILLLDPTFSFQDWWLWKHLQSKNVKGRSVWTLSLIRSFFFQRTTLSVLPARFAFSADVLLANKTGLQQYIAEEARLQWHRRISAAKGKRLGEVVSGMFSAPGWLKSQSSNSLIPYCNKSSHLQQRLWHFLLRWSKNSGISAVNEIPQWTKVLPSKILSSLFLTSFSPNYPW